LPVLRREAVQGEARQQNLLAHEHLVDIVLHQSIVAGEICPTGHRVDHTQHAAIPFSPACLYTAIVLHPTSEWSPGVSCARLRPPRPPPIPTPHPSVASAGRVRPRTVPPPPPLLRARPRPPA